MLAESARWKRHEFKGWINIDSRRFSKKVTRRKVDGKSRTRSSISRRKISFSSFQEIIERKRRIRRRKKEEVNERIIPIDGRNRLYDEWQRIGDSHDSRYRSLISRYYAAKLNYPPWPRTVSEREAKINSFVREGRNFVLNRISVSRWE